MGRILSEWHFGSVMASRFFQIAMLFWSLLIVLSFLYAYSSVRVAAFEGARLWARASFEKDVIIRHWAAMHGGVYVPVTSSTQPNPYLRNIAEREILTPSGRLLTLMNPAYMTRQIYELTESKNATRGHITSLNPIRPENTADAWEQEALRAFERGETERVAVVTENGRQILRFMRPFVTEIACLKCHETQGYKVGDIRGGISITVLLDPYIAIAHAQVITIALSHGLLWLCGGGALLFYVRTRIKRDEERGNAEERMKMSERQLSLIYNNIVELLMLVRVEGGMFRITSANRSLYRVFESFGVSLSETMVVGKEIGQFERQIAPGEELIDETHRYLEQVVSSKEAKTWERVFPLPSGTMYGLITFLPVLDDQGECIYVLWFCRNITMRVNMLKSLRETEEKYQNLFNTMIDGVALVELIRDDGGAVADYRYLDANPSLEKIFGCSRKDIIGKRLKELFPHVEAEWIAFVGESGTGDNSGYFERYLEHLNKYVRGQIYSPGPEQRAIIFSDDTEQWRMRREKNALEEQLLQSQKMEAIGQLAGGIAHDFNNILTSIISNAYVLKRRIAPESEAFLFIDEILAEAGRAANLTKGLLAFSRKKSVNLTPVPINQLLIRMQGMLKRIIGEDITISVTLWEEDVSALADAGQLEQVLMNLATNARDAMPEGGKLELQSEVVEVDSAFIKKHGFGEAARYAVIRMADSGQGMDEATQDKIFEPFFTTKEVGKGTGLGLAIAYGIIKQHRGYMEVESSPGNGSAFSVYLPIAGESADLREAASCGDVPYGRQETVLIAEDEDSVRKGMRKLLEDAGYSVIEACNGEEAVAQYREHDGRIDLVILDIIMPRMNGKAVYDALREYDPQVKAMFLSGYAGDTISRQGLENIDAKVLEKPCTPSLFLEMVRKELDS